MTKHTQTICSQVLRVNCQSVFDHLVGLVLKGLRQDVFMVIPSTSAESKKLSLISPKNNNSIAVLANKEKKFYPGRWIFFVLSICIHKVFIICLYSTLVVLLDSQSALVSRILSMISKVYLEHCQTSMTQLSRENSQRLSAVKYFCKIALSKIFTGF